MLIVCVLTQRERVIINTNGTLTLLQVLLAHCTFLQPFIFFISLDFIHFVSGGIVKPLFCEHSIYIFVCNVTHFKGIFTFLFMSQSCTFKYIHFRHYLIDLFSSSFA